MPQRRQPKLETVANPTGSPRPVQLISDRGKRYRATAAAQNIDFGPGRPRCHYCGKPGRMKDAPRPPKANPRPVLMIDHIDGHEENSAAHNLTRACRSCNTKKGAYFAKIGKGRRTAQYNPKGKGARDWKQYSVAAMTLRGYETGMKFEDARQLMHNTPANKRSEFASEIYAESKRRGGHQRKAKYTDEVPF